jgi:PAT family beta-lactamase induction signal transducer AmpG
MLPHTPAIFALAMVSENIFWAASFTAMEIIAFGAIGKNNPFASTQYALIVSVASLPLVYMQLLDGQAYGLGGLNAMFATDGGLGLLACLLLAILLVVWSRMRRGEPVPPPP